MNAPKPKEYRAALRIARRRALSASYDGTRCPCCRQLLKVYAYHLNAKLGRFLTKLASLDATTIMAAVRLADSRGEPQQHGKWKIIGPYFHISRILDLRGDGKHGTDASRLRFWGLLEHRNGGYYAITEFGRAFVRQELIVPRRMFFLNNKPVAYDSDVGWTTFMATMGDTGIFKLSEHWRLGTQKPQWMNDALMTWRGTSVSCAGNAALERTYRHNFVDGLSRWSPSEISQRTGKRKLRRMPW